MVNILSQILDSEQYNICKTLNDKTVKINRNPPESYRSPVRHLNDGHVAYHTFQRDRAYRVVLRNIHPNMTTDFIKEELNALGHRVRKIMNIRHRIHKTPLPLFFVDLVPAPNNKDIYEIKYIQNMRISVEPPRKTIP
jgi:hypothetical protein